MLRIFNIAILAIATTNIWAVDSRHWLSNFNIFAGYGYFNYHEINDQLDTYHSMDGIANLPNIGLDFEYGAMNFITKNQLSFSYNTYEKNESWKERKLAFRDIQYQLKAGYAVINNQYIRFFPFAGFLAQYQSINTDFNYVIRFIKCFFQYKNTYSNLTLGIIYGVSCELGLPLKMNILKNIKTGFDTGWTLPFQNKKWWINGNRINYPQYAPKSNFRYFWNLKLIYRI